MPERFLVLRGAFDGPLYFDDAGGWTPDRVGARRFDTRADAAAAQERIVLGGFAAAVVPGGWVTQSGQGGCCGGAT